MINLSKAIFVHHLTDRQGRVTFNKLAKAKKHYRLHKIYLISHTSAIATMSWYLQRVSCICVIHSAIHYVVGSCKPSTPYKLVLPVFDVILSFASMSAIPSSWYTVATSTNDICLFLLTHTGWTIGPQGWLPFACNTPCSGWIGTEAVERPGVNRVRFECRRPVSSRTCFYEQLMCSVEELFTYDVTRMPASIATRWSRPQRNEFTTCRQRLSSSAAGPRPPFNAENSLASSPIG